MITCTIQVCYFLYTKQILHYLVLRGSLIRTSAETDGREGGAHTGKDVPRVFSASRGVTLREAVSRTSSLVSMCGPVLRV